MYFVILAAIVFLLLDVVRSALAIRRATKQFVEHSKSKPALQTTFGEGTPFDMAILGDSTFDVRGDSKILYGPAQVLIDYFSRGHEVHVHMLAKAGAKSKDVVNAQLPQLKKIPQVDLLIVYMGANDAFTFRNPFAVGKRYDALFSFTEKRKIPVLASEVANYWYLSIFPLVGRAWLYPAIHIQNASIRHAARDRAHVTLVRTKQYHTRLHKKRHTTPYLADGVHATDEAAIGWGNHLLETARHGEATAKLFGA